jgi:uncharacterized protein YndB with AHSA1/START domain
MLSDLPTEDSKTLVIERILRAPRDLVWKMFSDPYHLAQWWGPRGFTNRVEKLDFRTGGRWLHVMIGPDGKELPVDNDIVEVTPPRRLVFRNAPVDPKAFGENPPPVFTKTLTFDEVDGGTRLTLVCTFDKPEHKDAVTRRGFRLGTDESFDKLEVHLAAL